MPDKAPPVYNWTVSVARSTSFGVEAAYPVIDDKGHMLLKDAEHKIVFAAEPGTGCTFTRGAMPGQDTVDHWTVEPGPGDSYRVIHDATGKLSEGRTEDEAFGKLVAKLIRSGDIVIRPGLPR